MKPTISTPTIIAHTMHYDNKPYLSVKRLQNAMHYINAALHEQGNADTYDLTFDPSPRTIEQAVLCNSRAFDLDPDGDLIYARRGIEYSCHGIMIPHLRGIFFCPDFSNSYQNYLPRYTPIFAPRSYPFSR